MTPLIPLPVGLDPGRLAETVDRALDRRTKRKENAWADLVDDLEATAKLVEGINKLYTKLLEGVKSQTRSRTTDPYDLAQQLREFLDDDTLLEKLAELQKVIAVASQERRFIRGPRRKAITDDLRGLEQATNNYIKHLNAIRVGKVPRNTQGAPLWNMSSVITALETGELPEGLSLQELCDEAIHNRGTDLTLPIRELSGSATQHIRGKYQ
jgi:hypothetical protein